ncbi:response regulator [Trichlorobacter lovleyi]|uniref:Response regulator receiver sensor signal transduction histidine kinase n=1 Tax=Trichlorobacter lovleyi (strain ATCC BAA-1151 / DSM 17278 / SZ) TaxID=398767 RepID=B3E9K4_TRIL1|nr:response regulator [Trichlorobacter lovleyi]ACD95280.1 response regulator receiver sensor signal transduction histidine kinase [Trichlorobacter lovleyi SZ]QOX78574.1 response regulator [Trichlorobacter lovleyi]
MIDSLPPSAIVTRPRLLFVDDDPGVLAAVTRFMRRYRFEVKTALHGQVGLQELQQNGPFHVVISDFRMPGMTGEMFLGKVAELAPNTRRMILSAYADSDLLLAAINAGRVHRYLTKPWDSQELLTIIRELIDEYQQVVLRNDQVQLLSDTNQQLETSLHQHTSEMEAQGRRLQESNRRLSLLSAHLEKVREDERRSIARDIHDDLGQTLTAMHLEITAMLHADNVIDLTPRLCDLKKQVDAAIGTVQRIISTMRPQVLEELGLEAALESLAQEVRKRTNITCVTSCTLAGEPISQEVASCLYRVAQESLTNVFRHSKATKVLLTVRRRDGWLQLQIRDNGVGVSEAQTAASNAFGVMGMRERVARCGGSFSISPRVGGGTIVEAQVPEKVEEAGL